MTLAEQILIRGIKAGRSAVHCGFGSPGQFLAMSFDEKLRVLTEPPLKKLPRMLDAADKAFWEEV
jgi:hypothetical protein